MPSMSTSMSLYSFSGSKIVSENDKSKLLLSICAKIGIGGVSSTHGPGISHCHPSSMAQTSLQPSSDSMLPSSHSCSPKLSPSPHTSLQFPLTPAPVGVSNVPLYPGVSSQLTHLPSCKKCSKGYLHEVHVVLLVQFKHGSSHEAHNPVS